MRPDLDTCRDPDLLAAEVRRLRAVIDSGEPTLTDAEREAIRFAAVLYEAGGRGDDAATLRGLLERTRENAVSTDIPKNEGFPASENARIQENQ